MVPGAAVTPQADSMATELLLYARVWWSTATWPSQPLALAKMHARQGTGAFMVVFLGKGHNH